MGKATIDRNVYELVALLLGICCTGDVWMYRWWRTLRSKG